MLALVAIAVAFAWPMQVNGYNQTAHYALVRALADGTPRIDRTLHEVGQISSGDVGIYNGHVYAAKPPGLALATLPWFLAVRAIGMRTTGDPTKVIWALALWGAVLPALGTVLLVRRFADRLEPGLGTATAVVAALGTMVLPFATLYFSHALSGFLGAAAFAVLWRERERPFRPLGVAVAGVLAGLAVTTDLQLAFVAAILGLYALTATPRLQRLLVYAGGCLAGLVPLLAFDEWAFGSLTHTAYEDYQKGTSTLARHHFLIAPSLHTARDLLFSTMGIVTLSPVLVCAAAGAIALCRGRRRAEGLTILGVTAVFLLYHFGFGGFGGLGPPRYLFPIVPFLGITLAVSLRRFPLTTVGLAVVSAFQFVLMTATGPLAAYDGAWLHRVRIHVFVQTAAAVVGVTGWYSIAPYFLAVAAAVASAAVVTRGVPIARRELPVAAAALMAWAAVAMLAPNPHGIPFDDAFVVALVGAVFAFVAALALHAGTGGWIPWAAPGPSADVRG